MSFSLKEELRSVESGAYIIVNTHHSDYVAISLPSSKWRNRSKERKARERERSSSALCNLSGVGCAVGRAQALRRGDAAMH